MQWTLKLAIQGGHRYFEAEDGRIGIADDSGQTPDRCDGGLFWLDKTRAVQIGKSCTIPVTQDTGIAGRDFRDYTATEYPDDAIKVALAFGLTIRCGPYVLRAE